MISARRAFLGMRFKTKFVLKSCLDSKQEMRKFSPISDAAGGICPKCLPIPSMNVVRYGLGNFQCFPFRIAI